MAVLQKRFHIMFSSVRQLFAAQSGIAMRSRLLVHNTHYIHAQRTSAVGGPVTGRYTLLVSWYAHRFDNRGVRPQGGSWLRAMSSGARDGGQQFIHSYTRCEGIPSLNL